jgi:UDP-GlcNAc:undecaprenyl-phosphate/decaprenyl-phosphate GlcNAc-1-phosphate transferase
MFSKLPFLYTFMICFLSSLVLTPLIKRFAIEFGVLDTPNSRKVHRTLIPRLGGLSIFFSSLIGVFYLKIYEIIDMKILIAIMLIVIIGVIDDKFNLPVKVKFFGQILGALLVVAYTDLRIEKIILPNDMVINFGISSYLITIMWILFVTNAINFIDGLDGLAAGVSVIALFSILILSLSNNQLLVMALCIIVIGSTLGFLVYNFYPAQIFMGDTGSLFLGFMLSIISIIGFYKSVTIFSLFPPIFILGVPLFDTVFAIIRRILNNQNITHADKSHIHHRLLELGFSHRNAVLAIYGISILFGILAVTISRTTIWQTLTIFILFIISIQIFAEITGLLGRKKMLIPIIKNLFHRVKLISKNK